MEAPTFVEEIDYRELQFGEVVGKGAFGVVSRARWRGKEVAVKRIESESEKKAFMQELKQLSRVSHPNIVCLYGACREHPVCLVMEYAEGGSLYNVLHGSGSQPHYTTAHAMSWALQCALGVEYLHGMKPKALIHRDLKPPNLLLIHCGTSLKICDFGTACDKQTHMTNNKGSAAWMAPEVFEGSKYSEKCDVFSWGIILWEVLARRKPFDEIGGPAFRIMWAVHKGTRPPLIQGIPQPLEVLMTKCWSGKPPERPSMSEVVRIMSHLSQFFKGAEQPLTIHGRDSEDSEEEEEEFSLSGFSSNISRSSFSTTPTNTTQISSQPAGESRSNTIRNSVQNNQEMESMVFQPVYMPPLLQANSPVIVEENRRTQLAASTPLARSQESLQESRSRSLTPVDTSRRYSDELSRYDGKDFVDHIGPAPSQRSVEASTSGRCIVAQETNPPPRELPQATGFNPASSPPRRSISHQPAPQQRQPMYQRSLSAASDPEEQQMFGAFSRIQQEQTNVTEGSAALDNNNLYMLLEPHLQPLAPYPTNSESMRIFEQHCKLAQEYIRIQTEIDVLSRRKQELNQEIEQERPQQNTCLVDIEVYSRLSAENESLMKYHADLKTQVEAYRRTAKRFPASPPSPLSN